MSNKPSEPREFEFSEMRKKLNAAHLEIIKSRQYRGARESDVVEWLAKYVEQNFVELSAFTELQKEIDKLNDRVFNAEWLWPPQVQEAEGRAQRFLGEKNKLAKQNQILTTEMDSLVASNAEMYEILSDLNVILKTALHNGHHDLIERVRAVVEKKENPK